MVEARCGVAGCPGSVEQALRLRDTLQLTDDQVAQLQALRQEAVADRQAAMEHLIDARSRFRAGQTTWEEFSDELESRQQEAQSMVDERQEQLSGILTEDQGEQLAGARWQTVWRGRGGWAGCGDWGSCGGAWGGARGCRGHGCFGHGHGFGPGGPWGGARGWMPPGAGRGFRRAPFRGRRPW